MLIGIAHGRLRRNGGKLDLVEAGAGYLQETETMACALGSAEARGDQHVQPVDRLRHVGDVDDIVAR